MTRRLELPAVLAASAAVALVLAALLLAALPAAAHSVPLRTEPAPGTIVPAAPGEVVLKFSEALEPRHSLVEVRDAGGRVVSEPSTIDPDGVTARAALPRGLAHGTYTIAWRALSAVDGHSTRGLSSFLYPDPARPLTAEELEAAQRVQQQAASSPWDAPLRAGMFAGAFALAGMGVVALWVAPGLLGPAAALAWARAGLAAGLAGALASVGVAALAAQAGGLGAEGIVAGRYGTLAAARAGLLTAGGVAAWSAWRFPARAREAWGAVLVLALGAMGTLSLTSHAAALPGGPPWALAADFVHQASSAAWVGGLAGLALALPRAPGAPWERIAGRFSTLASAMVALVVATGVAGAALQLRAPANLLATPYGQVLLAKVALVAGMLALGASNRLRRVPAMRAAPGAPGPRERFRRAVRAEAVLGAAVLVAAGALTALSPPAPPPEEAGPSVLRLAQEQEGVGLELLLSPVPVRAGFATFDLFVTAGGATDAAAHNATLRFLPPDRTLGTTEVRMEPIHPGHFGAEGAYLTMPGNWTVRASVPRQGAFDVVVDFGVEVAP